MTPDEILALGLECGIIRMGDTTTQLLALIEYTQAVAARLDAACKADCPLKRDSGGYARDFEFSMD